MKQPSLSSIFFQKTCIFLDKAVVLECALGKMWCLAGGFWRQRPFGPEVRKAGYSPALDFVSRRQAFQSLGTVFSIPGTEKTKPGIEKTKPPIEISIPGTGISIGGVGRHFCCTLPFSLIHLTLGRKTWLKGLKTYAHARVHAYAHT